MAPEVYSSAAHPGPQIRPATRDDVPAMLAIYNDAVRHSTATYDLEPVSLTERLAWFDEKVAGDWPVLVSTSPGEPAGTDVVTGFSAYGPFRPKAGYDATVEHTVYVAADHRGAGLGTALLVPLIEHAREHGRHVMVAGIDSENTGSIAFHEALGFVQAGRIREVGRKFDRWLDVVYLQLTL